MSMHAIDTLQYTEDLKHAGMSDAQAQAMARAHDTLFRNLLDSRLATKQDLENQSIALRSGMESQSAALRSEIESQGATLRSEMAELRSELKADVSEIRSGMSDLRTEFKSGLLRHTLATVSMLGSLIVILEFLH